MRIIGLCGGSGSGKGTVASIFMEHGIPSVDTDALYRKMTANDSPCLRALSLEFGKEIISSDGSLDRKKLASLVFTGEGAEKRLLRLNQISHSYILAQTEELLKEYASQGYRAALVDAPVLFESGFDKKCEQVVCVIADKNIRISRIMLRDSLSLKKAEERIASQMSDAELVSRCDYVITNNGTVESIRSQVCEIAKQLLK